VTVKCLAEVHNAMSPARARTRSIDPETSALTMRPECLPNVNEHGYILVNLNKRKIMMHKAHFKTERLLQSHKMTEIKSCYVEILIG